MIYPNKVQYKWNCFSLNRLHYKQDISRAKS